MFKSKTFKKYRLVAIYIILLFYSLSFLKLSISDLWFGTTSLTWTCVEGIVLDTVLIEKSIQDEMKWIPEIKYKYLVEDKSYYGNKISFSRSNFDKEQASDIIKDYLVNDVIKIYFSPWNPDISCIKPGLEKQVVFFSILGFGGIFAVVFSILREKKRSS